MSCQISWFNYADNFYLPCKTTTHVIKIRKSYSTDCYGNPICSNIFAMLFNHFLRVGSYAADHGLINKTDTKAKFVI